LDAVDQLHTGEASFVAQLTTYRVFYIAYTLVIMLRFFRAFEAQPHLDAAWSWACEQLLLDFQQVQKDYKNGLKARQGHELAVLMPEISEEQREEMIQNGETTSTVLVQRMAGAHATLVDEVNRIREKHQDVLRVEQSIADMAQMFQEMAVLVNNHGEMLDSIEEHTRQVKAATAKGEQNLKQTMKAQHQHRRYLCCMMIIMIIVAISILSPVLARA